jgi:hypothetical protein
MLYPSPSALFWRRHPRVARVVHLAAAALAVSALAASAANAQAGREESPPPLPVPVPEVESAEAASAPPMASGGWIAVIGDGASAEREAAEMLRRWAEGAAPVLEPVEERLPNGVVKLHHRGNFLSTLYATLDERGRLRYSHEPPAVADGDPSSSGVAAADPAASEPSRPEGGAQ